MFLRTFGAGVLDLLPEAIWDRLLVIRSAPGGGKTSLMRLFGAESLATLHAKRGDFDELAERLTSLGALSDDGPRFVGIKVSLEGNYRPLLHIGGPPEAGLRLFFRLLDARLAVATVRACLAFVGKMFPQESDSFRVVLGRDTSVPADLRGFGDLSGGALLDSSRRVEDEILGLLDSLLPVDWADVPKGHGDLYWLSVLSGAELLIDGRPLRVRPLVLLDDGDQLASDHRRELLERLTRRDLQLARWYAERFEAMSPQEIVLAGDIEGRDYELLELENAARDHRRPGRSRARFEKVLLNVGDLRAHRALQRYSEADVAFSELVDVDEEQDLGEREATILHELERRVTELTGGEQRFGGLIETARDQRGYAAAIRWREVEILIHRYRNRPEQELFDLPVGAREAGRLGGGATREAAELFLAREFRLPYYWGADTLARLSSHNIEQFLAICGDLFDEMIAQLMLNQSPRLSAIRQDAVVRRTSENLWREIPRRVRHGREVETFLTAVGRLARQETFRPNAPYAPGVTGTALTMRDRDALLDDNVRRRIPGAQSLFEALGAGIAFNLFSAELERSVKGDRYMVLYINRLLCPRLGLPLGRGGFRERRLEVMAAWMAPEYGLGTLPEAELELPL
jgi:hypothetical protein